MSAWLSGVAAELDQVDQVVRTQLRAMWRERRSRWGAVTLSHHQASTLLRGIIPSAVASTPRRRQHARLAAALHHAGMQILRLNEDPAIAHRHTIEAPIAAVLELADEAREWARQARWSQATAGAKVKGWRCPAPITDLTQLLTPEQRANAPAAAAAPLNPMTHHRQLVARSRARIQPDQLDLPLPPPRSAEIIDLRQLTLFAAAA